jgi:hypothetical protein
MSKLATIYPNRIVVRHRPSVELRPFKQRFYDSEIKKLERKEINTISPRSLANLNKSKSSVNMSATSKRTLRDSILLLYQLSTPRTVQINNKKSIYNYRASFITLTLPSTQIHSDTEIKKQLNTFLTNLRTTLGVNNYVWKAELQKNSNIHFHLIIDKYVSFTVIRYYWNKAINNLGYVDRYKEKFNKMSLKEYARHRNLSISDSYNSYKKGVSQGWTKPNSVDVNSVRNDKQLAVYLSKYFAKSDESNIDLERVQQFGKVWARSRSLSAIKLITRFYWEDFKRNLHSFLLDAKNFVHKVYEWNEVYYFKFSTMSKRLDTWLRNHLISQAKSFSYPFPDI